MADDPKDALPLVSSAKTADVMNAIIQLQLDITRWSTRSDTLMETIQKTQESMGKKLDDLTASMTVVQNNNGIMRQQIDANKKTLEDHEIRLREKTKRMEEIDKLHEDVRDIKKDAEKLITSFAEFQDQQRKRDEAQDQKFEDFKSWVMLRVGIGVGIGWLLGIVTPIVLHLVN